MFRRINKRAKLSSLSNFCFFIYCKNSLINNQISQFDCAIVETNASQFLLLQYTKQISKLNREHILKIKITLLIILKTTSRRDFRSNSNQFCSNKIKKSLTIAKIQKT